MPSIFSKNCVLMGEVDSYCLVCCKHLSAEHDVLAHIHHSKHKHNLSSHHYFDKFECDCIRKVAGVYYCEFCNMTFPTAAKVGLHVTEQTHLERKTEPMLTRADKCIMFQENILITENAWNGLVDDTCVLCNVEFEDDSSHKSEQNHILNLIKSRVSVGAKKDIFRQVHGAYQCLTCNKVISANLIKEHSDSAQHQSLLTTSIGNQNDVCNEKDSDDGYKDLIVSKDDAQRNGSATDKSAENDKNILKDGQSNAVNGKSLSTRRKLINKDQKQTSAKSIDTDVESFAKQHGLSVKKHDSKFYCNTCSAEVPATLQRVKEHVEGRKHTDKLSKHSDVEKQSQIKPKKVLLKKFVARTEFLEINLLDTNKAIPHVLFNNNYLLNVFKFLGFARFNDKIICQICRVHVTQENKDIHINSKQHKSILDNCYIVTSVEGEFIRQLKPDLYDCTYCGHVEHDWDDMLDHLDTDEHKRCKDVHETLSLDYRMSVIAHHVKNSVPFNLLAMLNNMRRF